MGTTYDMAKEALNDLYNDKNYSIEEAMENLQGLQDEINTLLGCLKDDLEAQPQ